MSSQYRMIDLSCDGEIGRPLIWGWFLMALTKSSVPIMKRKPAIGSPCLTPELKGMSGESVLLMSSVVDECERRALTI